MTQIEQLDQHFRNGGSLTPGEALIQFGVYALSQRAGQLRTEFGKPVVSAWEKTEGGARVKRYRYVMIGEQQALRLEAHDEAPGNRPHSAANGR